jgi:hypothetical protein
MAIHIDAGGFAFEAAFEAGNVYYPSRQLARFNSSLSRDSEENTYGPINPTANTSLRFIIRVNFEVSTSRWYVTVSDKVGTYNTIGFTLTPDTPEIPNGPFIPVPRGITAYYAYVAYVPGQADVPPDVTQTWTIIGKNPYVSALHLSFP